MKKIILAVLFFMVVGVGSAYAIQIQGDITNLDLDTPSLTVVDENGSLVTVVITPQTDVQRGMRDIAVKDLEIGNIVVLRYDVKAGKNIARYVGLVSRGISEKRRKAQFAK